MSDVTPQIGDIIFSTVGTRYVVYNVGAAKMSVVSENGYVFPYRYDSHYSHDWIDTVQRNGKVIELPVENTVKFGQVWESEHDEDCVVVGVGDNSVVVAHEGEGFTWEYDKTYFYNKYSLKEQE